MKNIRKKYELTQFQSSVTKYMEVKKVQLIFEGVQRLEVSFQRTDLTIFLKGCLITSCLNGGSCLPNNKKQTFSCSCEQPWAGERCEVKKGNFKTYLLYIQCADIKPIQTMAKTKLRSR